MPAFKESDGKPAFPSAEEVWALRGEKPTVECLVNVEQGETGRVYGPVAASYDGCATAWTYKDPDGPVTVRVTPLSEFIPWGGSRSSPLPPGTFSFST